MAKKNKKGGRVTPPKDRPKDQAEQPPARHRGYFGFTPDSTFTVVGGPAQYGVVVRKGAEVHGGSFDISGVDTAVDNDGDFNPDGLDID
jgi:hypothetical protein